MDNTNISEKKRLYYKEYYRKNREYFINRNKIKNDPDKQKYYKEYYKKNKNNKKVKETIIKYVDSIIVYFS
jgi:hypothetical protein